MTFLLKNTTNISKYLSKKNPTFMTV